MPSKVELLVEIVAKNAEAKLRELDNLARQMGNRKITLNFDEASLERWKKATADMTNAQISAYAKMAVAAEQTAQAEINAGGETFLLISVYYSSKACGKNQELSAEKRGLGKL